MRSPRVRTAIRVAAAVLVVIGGVLHLNIWRTDYRGSKLPGSVPGSFVVKVGFPVNAAASLLLAIALVVLAERLVVVIAGVLFEAACILTLVLSRGGGVFGWKEQGWGNKPTSVLVAEIAATVALVVLAAVIVGADRGRRRLGPAGA